MGILKIYVIVVTIESFEQILDFWHIFFTNQDHFRPLGIGGIRNFTHYGKGKGKNGRKNNQMTHQFHNFLLVVGSLAFIEVIVLQNSDTQDLRIFKNNPQCPPLGPGGGTDLKKWKNSRRPAQFYYMVRFSPLPILNSPKNQNQFPIEDPLKGVFYM